MVGIGGEIQGAAGSEYEFAGSMISDAEFLNDEFGDFLTTLDDEIATIGDEVEAYVRLSAADYN